MKSMNLLNWLKEEKGISFADFRVLPDLSKLCIVREYRNYRANNGDAHMSLAEWYSVLNQCTCA